MSRQTPSKRCICCRLIFKIQRNPRQRYCSRSSCQRIRKEKWRSHKRKIDPDYHSNQAAANKQWQKKHSDYWRRYRANHPEYTDNNRKKQSNRQQQQRQLAKTWQTKEFAKSDALQSKNDLVSGSYCLLAVSGKEFAKSDAFIVKIISKSVGCNDFSGIFNSLQRDHLIVGS
jgi:hypothetical protein